MTDKRVVYILSPEPWGTNKVSKHHYASLLARQENQVYFINPRSDNYHLEEVEPNLFAINYTSKRGLNKLPWFLRRVFQIWLAKRIMKKLQLPTPDIVWSFDPYVFQNLNCFSSKAFKIYHPVDDHLTPLEWTCAQTADLILAVSDMILDKFETLQKPRGFINHGLADHFVAHASSYNPPEKGKIKVGLVGNLNYAQMDYPTLFRIIEQNPSIQFVFIGPYAVDNLSDRVLFESEIQRLRTYENTELRGPVVSDQLPTTLDEMDAFLICYDSETYKRHTSNSHKVLEYLSTGRPIVSHYIDQYKDQTELIYMAKTNDQLPKVFNKIMKEIEIWSSQELSEKRSTFARENSYRLQLNKIQAAVSKAGFSWSNTGNGNL
ncbi:MAG: hypothetical protein ABJF11_17430 [Reichenbachiella sp.]|uniref:hypothetical protein n=1 Tax=Reichenbachiella sp. TaxID=2184521 RepID=UPI003264F6AD